MDLIKDRFQIICKTASEGSFICPAVDRNGACPVYTNNGVIAAERTGCDYKNVRAPIVVKGAKKVRVGQQKQAPKRNVKAGTIAE